MVPLREEGLDRERMGTESRPRFPVFRPQVDSAQPGYPDHGHRAVAAVQPFFQGTFRLWSKFGDKTAVYGVHAIEICGRTKKYAYNSFGLQHSSLILLFLLEKIRSTNFQTSCLPTLFSVLGLTKRNKTGACFLSRLTTPPSFRMWPSQRRRAS